MSRKDETINDLRMGVSTHSRELVAESVPQVAPPTGLIYGLEAVPPLTETIFAALQHVLACFVGIITPSLIIGGALQLPPETVAYLVSMSLFVSGVATFIQVKKIGPVGSGLLSIQGTSFAFIGPALSRCFFVSFSFAEQTSSRDVRFLLIELGLGNW